MRSFLILLVCIAVSDNLFSQSDKYAEALKLKEVSNYKEAFPAFQTLIKSDSTNPNYLAQGSQVYTRYAYLYISKEKHKQEYYQIASSLAQKAIAIKEDNAESHFAYCLALGRINEKANNKNKIINAKLLKKELDRTIELDPKITNSYHILGRWHSVISGFSNAQKKVINKFYGGVPVGASYDEAIKAYKTAIVHAPNTIMHQYELCQAYYDMGSKSEAKSCLEKAVLMTVVTDEDKINIDKCKKLLKKVK